MKLKSKVENANIRGCEKRQNSKGEDYLLVRFEDESGAAVELVDKSIERQPFYKRNTNMDLVIEMYWTKQYSSVRIIDAKVIDDD